MTRRRKGQSLVEYVILVVSIALVVATGVTLFSHAVHARYVEASTDLRVETR